MVKHGLLSEIAYQHGLRNGLISVICPLRCFMKSEWYTCAFNSKTLDKKFEEQAASNMSSIIMELDLIYRYWYPHKIKDHENDTSCYQYHFSPKPLFSNKIILKYHFSPVPLFSNTIILQYHFSPIPLFSNTIILQ